MAAVRRCSDNNCKVIIKTWDIQSCVQRSQPKYFFTSERCQPKINLKGFLLKIGLNWLPCKHRLLGKRRRIYIQQHDQIYVSDIKERQKQNERKKKNKITVDG